MKFKEISCSSDNLKEVIQILKDLKINDKIEITPEKGKVRKFVISKEFEEGYIFISSGRKKALSTTRDGHIRLEYEGVLFQATMLTQVEWVKQIKII